MAGDEDNGRDSHGAEGIVIAGRYRLIERLGAGGMGRVWRAYDDSLDCEVALKEVWLPPMLSDAERADRLARAQREARNAARLRAHPHIVSVHDMVSHDGMPWIVMDLIPSRNLAQVVEELGPLPAEQVAKVGLGVLDALGASHAAGILHRDVKPPNVLLTTDGRVMLTDFGIAVQEADLTMTASGVLVGSPEFVAPERARGEASRGASDLFSLGATLYYACEGRSPFSRDTAVGVLTAILFEETAPVTRQPSLAPVISGLLVKDPAARWDAARARAELERLAGGTPGSGTRTDGIAGAATVVVPPGTGSGSSGSGTGTGAGSGSDSGSSSGDSGPGFNPFLTPSPSAAPAGRPGSSVGWGSSASYAAPPTMAGTPAPPSNPSTPYPPTPYPPTPYPPQAHQATTPYGPGPGYHSVQTAPKKSTTGRNVGIGAAAAVVVAGGIVAAIALSGGDKKHQDVVGPVDHSSSAASSSAHSSAPNSAASSPAGNPTSPSNSSPSDSQSSSPVSPPNAVDPATWDKAGTDKTQFVANQLLPTTFTDSKGVVYNATNQWTDDCVNSYESAQLKTLLTKYKCEKQAISTYVDKDNKILVDIAVLPLPDADSAANAFKDMQAKSAFNADDWGVWCPRTGPGSDICGAGKDTTNAQQYGYLQPNHRYLVHAVAMYVNLTSDATAQDWLKPAATSAAKQGGPQVAVQ
ncbi:MAG: serine/threonine protein kinase [Catenulispora sp.]|nr:serine/threonine protein kinase [Catenulispora sp.]